MSHRSSLVLRHDTARCFIATGGCSCAGCACQANHQRSEQRWHGRQNIDQSKPMGGSDAPGLLLPVHVLVRACAHLSVKEVHL